MASSSPSGVELKESEKMAAAGAGVALSFPANDSPSPSSTSKLPRRLRRRLSEPRCPSTAEEIEAKLKEADLRRQQFYEVLSNKARPKQRSPSRSSSQDVELGQRLEAKLNAAEQKRSSIIAEARMRLARLDEMRQAAKSGVEMRVEKQRGELVKKVESRVRQAEANRLLLLKLRRQRRAARKERTAQSLMRRTMQESKYMECVRIAIHQKRVAAERKRLALLEAERLKAQARLLQVQKAANSVYIQREMERIKKKHELEDRLQRARRQRIEFLRQRKGANCSPFAYDKVTHEEAEKLARKLSRCWRRFMKSSGTTYSLAKNFAALNINEKSAKSIPFEQLAVQLESDAALKAVKLLLSRLEVHLTVRQGTTYVGGMENIDHLLKRVATPKRRRNVSHASRSRRPKKPVSGGDRAQGCYKLSRYPVRIVLCAYMIVGHPDAVLSGKGVHETALAEAAVKFIQEFELLLEIILEGRSVKSSLDSSHMTFRSQLEAFDSAWCSYLYCFTVWKVKDAKLLEEDLVRTACQLERSMMHTCKLTPNGDNSDGLTHDMKAIQKQVMEDQILLKAKVLNLSGEAGIERMESALADVRTKFFASKESGSLLASPVAHISSPGYSCSSDGSPSPVSGEPSSKPGVNGRPSSVRSLFKEVAVTAAQEVTSSAPAVRGADLELRCGTSPITENELLVNEIVHQHRHDFADNLDINNEDDNGIKAKIKETMEKAFWDGVAESMKQEQPDFGWVLKLMTEVRDELCKMSPSSWREEITDTIDIDILSQVLESGALDMTYLGNILEYALATLEKLSAPTNDDEMRAAHQNLLREVREASQAGDVSNSSRAMAVIKGLRFILHQIQSLKREISRARIRMIEPMIKGPAGLEYLRKAFSNRYGPPSNASASLPVTKSWLCLVRTHAEQEWAEHVDSLSTLPTNQTAGTQEVLPTTLRTGGSASVTPGIPPLVPITPDKQQPECKGETIDLLVRLGLLKLVGGIEGLSEDVLAETLKLNLSRLRSAQSLIQKIIVISTSMLVLRQTLLSEHLVTSPSDMEAIISASTKQLSELLDTVEDVGITEIVDAIVGLPNNEDHFVNLEKLQTRKEVLSSMLSKSLKEGDPIFVRVSRAIFLAERAAVLGGTGSSGRQLVEMALRRVGAALLADKVMEVAEMLIVMAMVSRSVHGEWYDELLKDM
ncbi:hypothetical protein Cgig2_017364 [Carnegiea gigantea]|uniref:T-complex protein 11 n=1 Tax=Carnegiea gigantea TaxID=171969 RepID=A0A9Q1K4Z4_9CARY|nr:hypothetical protein Cgig2_017364 [Carnegiea gigantea]